MSYLNASQQYFGVLVLGCKSPPCGLRHHFPSEVDNGITSIVPIINSLPALYTKLWEGKCLTLFMVKIRLTPSKSLY